MPCSTEKPYKQTSNPANGYHRHHSPSNTTVNRAIIVMQDTVVQLARYLVLGTMVTLVK